ncbi:hypothetical protein BdWA1_001217 [Babesia duncani]|uniref:Uncharacterized protein n=1 Tax=Babesia duncani TaxID=323732 RepID=A0AAD9PPF0_9APIC|nr:hypothetical protein BdWA1_001217 [Babesia duncani]
MSFFGGKPLATNSYNPFTGSTVPTINPNSNPSPFGNQQNQTGFNPFHQVQSQPNQPFGQPVNSPFQQQQQPSIFGQQNQPLNQPFNQSQQSVFGQQSGFNQQPMFQQQPGFQQQQSIFGQQQNSPFSPNQSGMQNQTQFGSFNQQKPMAPNQQQNSQESYPKPVLGQLEPWMQQAYNAPRFEPGKIPEIPPQ